MTYPSIKVVALWLCAVLVFAGFVALGNWQLERRVWKLALMERVEQRVNAPAVAAPGVAQWSSVNRSDNEYSHVVLRGRFLQQQDTLVVAATELGSGYWVMSPFELHSGGIVLVNRGFIRQGVTPLAPPLERVEISGLLRVSEPDGSALRNNDPAAGRWYSRDVEAIAASHNLRVAPYFVDAAAKMPGSRGASAPSGGHTVIQFHNSHLVYAVTWYALALMVIVAAVLVVRETRQARIRD